MVARRLGVGVGLVVALCVLAGVVSTPKAAAYRGGPNSPITDPLNKELVRAIIADIDAQGLNATTTTAGRAAIWRAQVAAARFAPLTAISTVVVGSVTVWKIADAAGVGGYVYKKITGHSEFEGIGTGTVEYHLGEDQGDSWANSVFVSPGVKVWAFYNGYTGLIYATGAVTTYGEGHSTTLAKALMAQFDGVGHTDGGSICGPGGNSEGCVVRWRTQAEMNAEVEVEPASAGEWAAATGNNQATGGSNNDAGDSTVTDAELDAAFDELGANDDVDRSTPDDEDSDGQGKEDSVDDINREIDPDYEVGAFTMPSCIGGSLAECEALLDGLGYTGTITELELDIATADVDWPPGAVVLQSVGANTSYAQDDPLTLSLNPEADDMPFLLPAPNPGETYADYITRLQGQGWVGTATETTLSEAAGDPRLGPGAPVTVRIPAVSPYPVRTLKLPGGWPSVSPRMRPDTDVEIWHNPSTYAPVPEEQIPPATGGPGAPGPPGEIDFSPLTDIDPGCKFPYGFICYAIDVTEWFNVAPSAPVFSFTIPDVDVLGQTYHVDAPYEVDLGIMDAYMAIIRTLMSVAMWIGAVYWLAVKLLGFNAGGDPGEAVDEGFTT